MGKYIIIPLSKRGKHKGQYETVIDKQDIIFEQYHWYASKGRSTRYACRSKSLHKPYVYSPLYLHRLIAQCAIGRPLLKTELIDHIDHDGLNNRRSNLRIVSHSENLINQKTRESSVSGHVGVRPSGDKWEAYIYIGKHIHLGAFTSIEEAVSARTKAVNNLLPSHI